MSARGGACPFGSLAEIDAAIVEAGGTSALADAHGVWDRSVRRWRQRLAASPSLIVPAAEPWLGRRAQLVERAVTAGRDEVVVFVSDLHAPFHSVPAVGAALSIIEAIQPDRVVLNGDIADYFAISRHNRNASRLDSLQGEIDTANELRAAFRAAAPDAVIDETEGNHDSRLRTFVASEAAALGSLRVLDPANLNAWAENGIRPHGAEGFLLRPYFLVYHGTRARQVTGTTARAELGAAGINGTSGHTHRLGPGYDRSGYGPRREWWESGCLCQLTPDYITGAPDWRNGLLVGSFSGKSDAYAIEMAQDVDGALAFGGKLYRGAEA